jgi:NO-binding membrane sensor protein with MHYT domain
LTIADPVQLVSYYTNRAIPISPLPGILVLSIIGSYATLLLLGRRTSARGLRNHFFLGLAATCFAAVAVWGMHFVSMISIRLKASPDVTWFLLVSRG